MTNPRPGYSSCQTETVTIVEGDHGAASFRDHADFQRRGWHVAHRRMLVCAVAASPGTEVAVPLDAPDYARIGPAEALALLRELPDMALIRRLTVCDGAQADEPWLRQVTGRPLTMLAEALPDGEVRLYRPVAGEGLVTTALHEWSHLLRFRAGEGMRGSFCSGVR